MTGLLLLFVGFLWLFAAFWIAKLVTKKISAKRWRIAARALLTLALVPLPLIDEIVAKGQFERLCEVNATTSVNRESARGKAVYLADVPDVEIKDAWVRIILQPRRFVDVNTGETVVSYSTLVAEGGRLVQILGISEGNTPLTFKSWCKPKDQRNVDELFRDLQITVLRRSSKNDGATK